MRVLRVLRGRRGSSLLYIELSPCALQTEAQGCTIDSECTEELHMYHPRLHFCVYVPVMHANEGRVRYGFAIPNRNHRG
jgi:hypothetical protein